MRHKTVAVVSGGMDSVTLAHLLVSRSDDVTLISFDYGQRHAKELTYAKLTASTLGLDHEIVDLQGLRALLRASSLTSDQEVPEGHYAAETMAQTVVPNRNAILLNIATGYAITLGADRVSTGVHAGDHYVYPDCRPMFIESLTHMLRIANEGFIAKGFRIETPFLYRTKAEIVGIGAGLGVDWTQTWSCYQGGTYHCGRCGTCVERIEAFDLAGVKDPTVYMDREFARREIETRKQSTRLT